MKRTKNKGSVAKKSRIMANGRKFEIRKKNKKKIS